MKKIIENFLSIFDGYELAYGQHSNFITEESGKQKGSAQTIKDTLKNEIVQKHLDGTGASLGIVPLKKNNKVKFGVVDLDIKGNNSIQAGSIIEIEKEINKLGLPLVACQSKSKGVHLYCFTQKEVPAKLMVKRLKEWASLLGYGNHEIFPKQTIRVNDGVIGNWINLPYYNYKDTVRYCVNKGKKLSIEKFFEFIKVMRISEDELKKFELEFEDDSYDDAPPCLQILANKEVIEGCRNEGLFSFGVYFKKKYPDNFEEKIMEINGKLFSPPLGVREVEGIIKVANKNKYFYRCNESPICELCNKVECKKRKFGIGTKSIKNDNFTFDSLEKYVSGDDVIWKALCQGKTIRLTTEELLNVRFARKAIAKQSTILIKKISQDIWFDRIEQLFSNCVIIIDPKDASNKGQFEQLLDAFLTNGTPSDEKRDLLAGNIYLNKKEKLIYFKSTSLSEYLKNKRFKHNMQEIWHWLREIGCEKKQLSVGNKKMKIWYLPAPEIYKEDNFEEKV